jgi:hypothetical protein
MLRSEEKMARRAPGGRFGARREPIGKFMRFIPFAAAPTLVSRRGKSINRACAENPGSSGSHHTAERCRHEIVCQHRIATKRQGGVQIALKRRPDFLLLA